MFLLRLLYVLMLFRGGGQAIPLLRRLDERATGPENLDSGGPEGRTLLTIVWGCFTTMFICTWISVHPNVPPQPDEECGWKSFFRRLRLMFWALVAPELILSWSASQWHVAGEIANFYNLKKGMKEEGMWDGLLSSVKDFFRGKEGSVNKAWKRAHGHLVAMGGVVLVEGDEESESSDGTSLTARDSDSNCTTEVAQAERQPIILTFEILQSLLKDPKSKFSIDVTDKEIEDKAKGDFLSKSIVVFQTTWFIMQCVARFTQRLAVTELEVVTLALASLNAFMFFFWWNKPLGLRVPIKVYLKGRLDKGQLEDHKVPPFRRVINKCHEKMEKIALRILDRLLHGEHCLLICFLLVLASVLGALLAILLGPFILASVSVYTVMVTRTVAWSATHVPAFYSPSSGSNIKIFRIIYPIFGSVFGGVHCLGQFFSFPTMAERKLWEISSLTITFIPIFYGLFSVIENSKNATFRKIGVGLLGPVMGATAYVYVLARFTLLVEALILLRNQPSSAFIAVDWIKYVPNIAL